MSLWVYKFVSFVDKRPAWKASEQLAQGIALGEEYEGNAPYKGKRIN